MPLKELAAAAVGIPEYQFEPATGVSAFDLSSHARAGQALQFGLDTPGNDHNVYVLGPDRSGRMTATREFVEGWAQGRAPADDWIYVVDFEAPSTPRPIRLPAGTGRRFKSAVEEMVPVLARELASAFGSESYQRQATTLRAQNDAQIQSQLNALEADAHAARLSIINTPQGAIVAAIGDDGNPMPVNMLPPDQRAQLEERSRPLIERMAEINRDAARFQRQFFETLKGFNRDMAARATEGLLAGLRDRFHSFGQLVEWIDGLRRDLVEHHELLVTTEDGVVAPRTQRSERRYYINLLVHPSREKHPPVICENNTPYENQVGLLD